MRRMPWTICLWPGLPQIWSYGSWPGLAVALGAAAVLDVLLVVSFGWSELIGRDLRSALWSGFAAAWIVAAGWSLWQCRRQVAMCGCETAEDGFARAADYYLKGDGYQAEQILEGLLRRDVRDVDARLMLATLLRHAGRLDEATRQLDVLSRFEGAGKWEVEIQNERDLLAEANKRKKKASAA
jgi:hypothetical protein